jgi:uncharacterized protein YwgA
VIIPGIRSRKADFNRRCAMPSEMRPAALVALVESARNIGKIQLQKLVYFLQETGLPLNYSFEIYLYGPFSHQLARDIGTLDSLEVLRVESNPDGYGFHITPGKFASGHKLPKKYDHHLNRVMRSFGNDTASQLEVKATVHFVNSVVQMSGKKAEDVVLQRVKALKPHFSERFLRKCMDDLKRDSWL